MYQKSHEERIRDSRRKAPLFIDQIHFRRNPESGEIKAIFQFFDKTVKLSTGDFASDINEYAMSKRGKQVRAKIKEITSKIIVRDGNPANLYAYFSQWKNGTDYKKKGRIIEKKATVSVIFRAKGLLYIRYYYAGEQLVFSPGLGIREGDIIRNSETRKIVSDLLHYCRTIAAQKPTPADFKSQVLTYVERMPIFV